MYPQYDSYPDQRSQMHYTHHYPTFFIPPQMSVNPVSHSPVAYEPWFYGGNYGCHNYFHPYHCSGYSHPYHPQSPLPYFHDACCPSFSKIRHPVHYAPPPNYSMELPIYDYDKKPHRRCPYHPCSWGGDTMEKEPVSEKTTDSLSSAQSKNLPYPIVWIPTEEMKTAKQMQGGCTEPELNTRNHDVSMNSSNQPCGSIKLEKGEKVENQFPFPIIWVPYKQEEAGKKYHIEGQTTPTRMMTGHEEGIPFKESVDSNVDQATTMVGKNDLIRCKLIPVKQLDEMVDNNNTISKEAEKELAKNNPEGGSSTKRQTSPLSKTCKLPPVCLRVEPFPKRKNGSGKSRSLSPPKKGRHQEESCAKTDLKEQSKLVDQAADEHTVLKTKEDGNSEATDSKEVKRKQLLTEVEAAVLIQAAYRGYEVRKWEPIKKLKEIGKVRDELDGVKSRIKASSSSSSSSLEEKERSLIGEMLMNLLLKLDTIQGLDPVARDMRKCTAKELVKLQEEVDCAVKKGEIVNNSLEMESSAASEEMKKHDDDDDEEEEEEEVKVCEGDVEANKKEEEVKACEGDVEANKKEEEVKACEGDVEANKEEVKVCEGNVEANKKEEEEVDCVVKKGEVVNNSLEMESSAAKSEEIKKHDDDYDKEEEVKVCEGGVEVNKKEEEVKVCEGDVEANKKEEEVKVCEGDVEANKKDEEEGGGVGDNGGATDGEDNKTIDSTFDIKEEKGMDEMMEQLVEKGKEQLEVIRELSERVKMLEKKLAATASKKRRAKTRTRR